ncbi:hypothetical protein SJ05684_c05040 [Sinorhizobium sojae CCBAU 05684]|uniref:Uncharacterized protein n=1 Tax=Sinorhizobium sojae CCBAU 05684 TaxID=716928 RepID=A0A249P7Q9_9HYPH|nr:hypothetical protein SJ05684_c05040 [Sinorhizobium sojae CCBAU 05684]
MNAAWVKFKRAISRLAWLQSVHRLFPLQIAGRGGWRLRRAEAETQRCCDFVLKSVPLWEFMQ